MCEEELGPLLKGHSQPIETPQGRSPGNKYLNFMLLPTPLAPPAAGTAPKPDIQEAREHSSPVVSPTDFLPEAKKRVGLRVKQRMSSPNHFPFISY